MLLLEPILGFDGQCEQAIELYKKAFGAEVIELIRYADANPQDLYKSATESDNHLIFHAQLKIGNQVILLGDGVDEDLPKGRQISLVIMSESEDEIKSAYNILADGATILEPMSSTTYSSCCVSLIDKFGIP